MERRTALKNLFIIGGAAALFPGCLLQDKKQGVKLSHLDVNADLQEQLAEVTEAIIPETDTPGSKSLGLHLFALKIVDECYQKDAQQSFVKGLKALDGYAKEKTGASFAKADSQQRAELLAGVKKGSADKDLAYFVAEIRQLTIEGYRSSEYVMTNLLPYQLVPGHFYGCVEVGHKNK